MTWGVTSTVGEAATRVRTGGQLGGGLAEMQNLIFSGMSHVIVRDACTQRNVRGQGERVMRVVKRKWCYMYLCCVYIDSI